MKIFNKVSKPELKHIVSIEMGDISNTKSDAIIIPQFVSANYVAGIASLLRNKGNHTEIQEYIEASNIGKIRKNDAYITKATKGNSFDNIIHLSLIDDKDKENLGSNIRATVRNALLIAEKHGLKSLAFNALGTGNGFSAEESSLAMFSAMQHHLDKGGFPFDIKVIIHGDEKAAKAFSSVLSDIDDYKIVARAAFNPDGSSKKSSEAQLDYYKEKFKNNSLHIRWAIDSDSMTRKFSF